MSEAAQAHPDPLNITEEVFPFKAPFDSVIDKVPRDHTLAITATETEKGLTVDNTVIRSVDALDSGFEHVVPHLAARSVEDEAHLFRLLDELTDAGLSEVFIIGGDRPAREGWEYPDGIALLEGLIAYNDQHSRRINTVGIPGYPDGHFEIPNDIIIADLLAKIEALDRGDLVGYIETSYEFDGKIVVNWMQRLREMGIILPIQVGVMGAPSWQKAWQAMTLNGGPEAALEFIEKRGMEHGDLALGKHVAKSLAMGGLVLSTFRDDPSLKLRGFTFSTMNDPKRTQRKFKTLISDAQEMGRD